MYVFLHEADKVGPLTCADKRTKNMSNSITARIDD